MRRPCSARPRFTPDVFSIGCTTTIAALEKKVVATSRSRDSESDPYPHMQPQSGTLMRTLVSTLRADRHFGPRDRLSHSAGMAGSLQWSDQSSLGRVRELEMK